MKIIAYCPISSRQIDGETMETVTDFILGGSKITANVDCSLLLGRKARQHIKKQRHYFANKCPSSQSYGFSSSHIWMWELDQIEGWASKNWCFWTFVLEKTLENPLDCKEIQAGYPKDNQSWISIGRIEAKAEASILWPPDVKSRVTGKDPNAGEDWWQEKRATENEMVGWHHQLNEHELEQTPGDREVQGSLQCYSSWDCKQLDTS